MTDKEIIKSLECCANGEDCKECAINPHKGNYGYCTSLAIKAALDLINRQKDEIEGLIVAQETLQKYVAKLNKELERKSAEAEKQSHNIRELTAENLKMIKYIKFLKAEVIKEFAERLKSSSGVWRIDGFDVGYLVPDEVLDTLLKETAGVNE